MRGRTVAGLLLAIAWSPACRDSSRPGAAVPPSTPRAALALPVEEAPQWVQAYDPARCASGYNLILYRRGIPALIDMNGAIVHAWPAVRVSARARLLPSGHLTVITDEGGFAEYDWDGSRTRGVSPPAGGFFHHDFARLRNGNDLLLAHRNRDRTDDLIEISPAGREVWRWQSKDHLAADLHRSERPADLTHINSVEELPPNPWFDAGHEEFRPGNILISSRNLTTLYVIDRDDGRVVWSYDADLDYQHEARMAPSGHPSAGSIFFFNNGTGNRRRYRRSEIVELDPVRRKTAWQYDSPLFFSSINGTEQLLPGGNILVTSSEGGRVFELTRDKRIVWQWVPPYLPMRVARYPYDFCPQLAARDRPTEVPVRRSDPNRYIDRDLYAFALPNEVRTAQVGPDRTRIGLLRDPNGCRSLILPEGARLDFGYGIKRNVVPKGSTPVAAHFGMTVRAPGERPRDVLQRTVDPARFTAVTKGHLELQHETVSLEDLPRQRVELCVSLVDAAGNRDPRGFVWVAPRIQAGDASAHDGEDEDKSEAARAHELEQLRALGYVN